MVDVLKTPLTKLEFPGRDMKARILNALARREKNPETVVDLVRMSRRDFLYHKSLWKGSLQSANLALKKLHPDLKVGMTEEEIERLIHG